MGNGLIFPCRCRLNADASGSAEPGIRPVELGTLVEAVMAGSGPIPG